jgi:signal transduction histidine kinase
MSLDFVEADDDFATCAVLHVDGNKITQVIRNLLSNALKFTASCNSAEKLVAVKVSYVSSSVSGRLNQGASCCSLEVCVTDTGPGIAKVCTF